MKIAIDCRYMGKSGIGRVCQGILDHLDYDRHEYYLIGVPEKLQGYAAKEIVEDRSDPFSFGGLRTFPKRLNRICDCLLIPNFIVPFKVKIPVYTVMHDLIFLDLPKITTRGFKDRKIKKMLIKRGVKRSRKIACVSAFTKSRCEHYFPKYAKKYFVNHIGLSDEVLGYDTNGVQKTNSLVYVGNVKPHKGLRTLIDAFHLLPKGKYCLKIIGEREGFLTGMREEDLRAEDVIFTGRLSDEELLREIAQAAYLVQPSLYEGFGLPPLEALYLGTQPIISDIPVFKEVYGALPVMFFEVENAQSLQNAIMQPHAPLQECRATVTELYNYQKFTDRLLEFLK